MTQTALASATDLHRLLDDLVERVPTADLSVLLSPDGLPLATSQAVTTESGDFVAAAAAALHALAVAAGRQLHGGTALRTIVEMEHMLLAVEPAGGGALLAVTCSAATDPEAVSGPIADTADRAARALAGTGLTPGGIR